MTDFAVLGAGAMGTAMSYLLASNEYDVLVWARRREVANQINRKRVNLEYMPNLVLPERVKATSSLRKCVTATDKVVIAIPSHAAYDLCAKVSKYPLSKTQWLSVVKGMDVDRKSTISKLLADELDIAENAVAVLSGPNFAVEIVVNTPTIGVLGCKSRNIGLIFRKALTTEYFLVEITDDLTGVEAGGILKNIGAIAIGIIDGLNLGDNTRGLMVSRYMREVLEVGTEVFHARRETLLGPACLGDMVTTAFSYKSRNRIIGLLASKCITDIPKNTFISEGKSNAEIVDDLCRKKGIKVPIIGFVESVLSGAKPLTAFNKLWENMKRDKRVLACH